MGFNSEDKDFDKWSYLNLELQKHQIKSLFDTFEANQIKPILIKGYSTAIFYPKVSERNFCDIDIAVSPFKFKDSQKIIKDGKYLNIHIDLHKGLRHLDTVSWDDLSKNSQIIKIDDADIRVLRPEDHLRIICVHWLTDGGEYKNKLWDVFWLITNRPKDFDWDRCLNTVNKKRRRWIVCTIGLAHKYLGLELSGTPIEDEAKELPRWFVKRIEKEWNSDVRLISMNLAVKNSKTFRQQIWKRFPPNPITSIINCEGSFDARIRVFYQVRDILNRLKRKYKLI